MLALTPSFAPPNPLTPCLRRHLPRLRTASPPPRARRLTPLPRAARMQASAPEPSAPSPDATTAAAPAIDVEASDVPTSAIKSDLLTLVNGTNRGIAASPRTRDEALALLRELEARGCGWAVPEDGAEDALVGTWRLVFTNALDILSLALLPVALGQIYQNVEKGTGGVDYMLYNEVEVEPLFAPVVNALGVGGRSCSRVRVAAEGRVSGAGREVPRVDITFVRSALEAMLLFGRDVAGWPKLEVPVNSPVGYIETVFIDDDMRVARSPPTPNAPQRNNYFVLLRE